MCASHRVVLADGGFRMLDAHHLVVLGALLIFIVAGGVDEYIFHRDIPRRIDLIEGAPGLDDLSGWSRWRRIGWRKKQLELEQVMERLGPLGRRNVNF